MAEVEEVVATWHDFSMIGRSRAKLTRLQYDMVELCLIETICAYEVVPYWHDLPKFIFFLNRSHFSKKQKKK